MRTRRNWLFLLLVMFVSVALLFVSFPPRQIQTGDTLLDWYANACNRNLARGNFSKPPFRLSEVEAAEQRFGGDPRYWQLRAWIAQREALFDIPPGGRRAAALSGSLPEQDTAVLRQAYADGKLDANSILLLLLGDRQNLSLDARAAMLDDAVARAEGNSWPLYLRGISRLSQDDLPGALADIRAGNQASSNISPGFFPDTELHAAILNDKVIGSPALMGAMIDHVSISGSGFTTGLLGIRSVINDKANATAFAKQPELFDELQLMICRMYESEHSLVIGLLGEAFSCGLAQVLLDDPAGLDPQLLTALPKVRALSLRITKQRIELMSSSHRSLKYASKELKKPLNLIPFFARRSSLEFLRLEYEDELAEQETVTKYYDPFFEALKHFRYTDPSTDSAMQRIIDTVPDPYANDEWP